MEQGLDLKLDFGQSQSTKQVWPLFRIFVASIEEAKKLARVSHQVGSLNFCLVMSSNSINQKDRVTHIPDGSQPNQRKGILPHSRTVLPHADCSSQMRVERQMSSSSRLNTDNELADQSSFNYFEPSNKVEPNRQYTKISHNGVKSQIAQRHDGGFLDRENQPLETFDHCTDAFEAASIQHQDQSESQYFNQWEMDQGHKSRDNCLQLTRKQQGIYNQEFQQDLKRSGTQLHSKILPLQHPQNVSLNGIENTSERMQRREFQQNPNLYQENQQINSNTQNGWGRSELSSNSTSLKNYSNKPLEHRQVNYQENNLNTEAWHRYQEERNRLSPAGVGMSRYCSEEQNQDCMEYLSSGPSYHEDSFLYSGELPLNRSLFSGQNKVHLAGGVRQGYLQEINPQLPMNYNTGMEFIPDNRSNLGATHSNQSKAGSRAYPVDWIPQERVQSSRFLNNANSGYDQKPIESKEHSSSRMYDTLLSSCYEQGDDLSISWKRRIHALAEKLKERPYSLFNSLEKQASEESEALRKFSGISELHPLGKFIHREPQSTETDTFREKYLDESRAYRHKYDQTNLVSLEFGHLNFGGNYVGTCYYPWKGVASVAEPILIASVSRGRLAKLPDDAGYEVKAEVIEQAHQDVIEWKRMFRSALTNQRIKDEQKLQEKERAMLGILEKTNSMEIEGKPDDLIYGGDNATKSSASNRSSTNYPGLHAILCKANEESKRSQDFAEAY